MQACRYVYDPTTTPRDNDKIVVYFDHDVKRLQTERARKVIAHLETLQQDDLNEESVLFFKWVVLHHLSSNQIYAQALLNFFHSKGLLKGKKTVHNPVKQMKGRYLVLFTMGSGKKKHTFAKVYNSIRELKTDTGKKPSQIKRKELQGKTNMSCSPL